MTIDPFSDDHRQFTCVKVFLRQKLWKLRDVSHHYNFDVRTVKDKCSEIAMEAFSLFMLGEAFVPFNGDPSLTDEANQNAKMHLYIKRLGHLFDEKIHESNPLTRDEMCAVESFDQAIIRECEEISGNLEIAKKMIDLFSIMLSPYLSDNQLPDELLMHEALLI